MNRVSEYQITRLTRIYIGASLIVICLSFLFIATAEDYDSGGRRDPFVPLVDERGLRSDLFLSGTEGELPVKLQIMGILWSEGDAMAIINGDVVKEGDFIGEVKVEKIEKESVNVSYRNKIYNLLLRIEEEGK